MVVMGHWTRAVWGGVGGQALAGEGSGGSGTRRARGESAGRCRGRSSRLGGFSFRPFSSIHAAYQDSAALGPPGQTL